MKALLKMEFKRAFHSVSFYLSLMIGMLICGAEFFMEVIPNAVNVVDGYIPSAISAPFSVFESWIGQGVCGSIYRNIYITMIPIISVMAYAGSYNRDRKYGYIKNIFTREKKYKYLIAKHLASCVSGGIAVVFPLLCNLLVTMAVLPSLLPQPTIGNLTRGLGLWSDVFYTHPYQFIFRFFVLIFIFQSVYVGIALAISEFADNSFLILLFPFLLGYFVHTLLCYINGPVRNWSPTYMVDMMEIRRLSLWQIILEWLVVMIVTGVIYYLKGVRDETL